MIDKKVITTIGNIDTYLQKLLSLKESFAQEKLNDKYSKPFNNINKDEIGFVKQMLESNGVIWYNLKEKNWDANSKLAGDRVVTNFVEMYKTSERWNWVIDKDLEWTESGMETLDAKIKIAKELNKSETFIEQHENRKENLKKIHNLRKEEQKLYKSIGNNAIKSLENIGIDIENVQKNVSKQLEKERQQYKEKEYELSLER